MANQKTLVVLEPSLRRIIERIAKENNMSISGVCRDFIKEALENYEDRHLNNEAEVREKGFPWKKGLSHKQVWGSR